MRHLTWHRILTSGIAVFSICGVALAEPESDSLVASPQSDETAKTSDNQNDSDAPASDIQSATKDESQDKPKSLTVASWGGAYTQAQKLAFFKPFQDESGIEIKIVSHKGRIATVVGKTDSSPAGWDLVDLDEMTLKAGCSNGTFARIEPDSLATLNSGEAKSDFIKGSLQECGIASGAWSSAIVYDKRAYKKTTPKKAVDFFDLKKFPGKRAIPRTAKYIAELALIADGVELDKVYTTLATESGLERVFKQLEKLEGHILWWDRAYQPTNILARQDAAMALAFNGRIFSAIVADNKPFGIVWDAQMYHLDYWAVPKASTHRRASLDFIAFAMRPESLARLASWFPYGPVRKSAVELVGKHPEINVDMKAFLPTAPGNFQRALKIDLSWWEDNGDKIAPHYRDWMEVAENADALAEDDY